MYEKIYATPKKGGRFKRFFLHRMKKGIDNPGMETEAEAEEVVSPKTPCRQSQSSHLGKDDVELDMSEGEEEEEENFEDLEYDPDPCMGRVDRFCKSVAKRYQE